MIKNRILLLALFGLFLKGAIAQQYDALNIDFLSNWRDDSFDYSGLDAHYNSIWGHYDPVKKREYAILGGTNGTYFIDVTHPLNPRMRAYVEGRQKNCIWREYKSYSNYAYLISDDASPNSFQIVDMSYLPDSVHVVHDSNDIFEQAHTLYIDGDKLYLASVRKKDNTYHPMEVYSLADPKKPTLLRSLSDDYPQIGGVHDMFVRNDTVYVSAGFQGLYVFKFMPDHRFIMLGSLTSYPGAGYNHSSWLTPDGKTLAFCDEVPDKLPAKIADVSDLSDIRVTSTFYSNQGATAHNPYIVGDKTLVLAYYQDGVQIYDISNPYNPKRTAYFDTHPQNGNNYPAGTAYNGCWGAYPFLPSGVLLASDRQNGLFVLDAGFSASVPKSKLPSVFKVSPNPAKDDIFVELPDTAGKLEVRIVDFTGKVHIQEEIYLQGRRGFSLNLSQSLASGIYFIQVKGEGINYFEKVIKQ
jgi:choice-of-anchor B domain-containing protein